MFMTMHLLCVWLLHLFSPGPGTQQFLSKMPPAVPHSRGDTRSQSPRLSYVSPMTEMFMMILSHVTQFITTLTLASTIVAIFAAFVHLWQAGVLHKMITRIAPYQLQMRTGLNSYILLLQLCLQRTRLLLQSDAHMTYSPILVHITPEGVHRRNYNSSRSPPSTQLLEPFPSNNYLIPKVSHYAILLQHLFSAFILNT